MIVTEQEAELKRCVLGVDKGSCVRQQCMAWRQFQKATPEQWDKMVPHPSDIAEARRAGYIDNPNHKGGMMKKTADAKPALYYCGMAGKP